VAQEDKLVKSSQKRKSGKDWILWTLVGVFVVAAIVVMLAVDYFYSPSLINPATLPDAVGK
jgi:hypothetical protein